LSQASRFIQALKELGRKFALDDFGTGLSSFGYLKHFLVDFLKIDGGFVKGVLHDPIGREMIRSINEIAFATSPNCGRSSGVTVVRSRPARPWAPRPRPCRPRAKGRRSPEFEQGDDMDQVSAAAAAPESRLETLRTAPAGEDGK
jgi:hypothetical protein